MKRTVYVCCVGLLGIGAFLGGVRWSRQGAGEVQAGTRPVRYICPMHPQYTSDRPGTAPCCGMRLEPAGATEARADAGRSPALQDGIVAVSPERQQLMGIRIGWAERTATTRVLRAPGRVAPDETRTYRVNAAVDGWIREVFPHSTGSIVRQGQPLATFYSKEFLPAQQSYFYALNTLDRVESSQPTSEQLSLTRIQVWAQEDNLANLGMSEAQIREIAASRQYARAIVIRAPANGLVLSRNVSPGQRFQRGEELYRIADLERVWVLADVFEPEARSIRAGGEARVLYQGQTRRGRVSEVPPQFDAATRTLKVRIELANPGATLRPDMFVDVELPLALPPAVTVPAEAVVDAGLRKTVFVDRGDGMFEPRAVETGWRFGDRIEIRRGLDAGERIVVSGNFLLDSESRMKRATGIRAAPAKDPVCGMEADPGRAEAEGRVSTHDGRTYYFCANSCKQAFDKEPERYAQSSGSRPREPR